MQNFFFFPDRVKYSSPENAGLKFEDVYFHSADGTALTGWFIPAIGGVESAKGTVIHLHGNAQNMTAHWGFTEWLPSRGFNLFVFDYRGYGQSHGEPEEQGVFEDSVAALDYLRSRSDIDISKLLVFGQSLGGMLAIAASGASKEGIKAVVAEAPVYSYSDWAFDMMPELQLACDDEYCATTYVANIAPIPLLLLHGTADRVVPYSHSEQLLKEAREPKQLVMIEGGQHNDAMTARHGTTYQDLVVEFFVAALA